MVGEKGKSTRAEKENTKFKARTSDYLLFKDICLHEDLK